MLDVGNQKRKEKRRKHKDGNVGACGKEQEAPDGEECKKHKHNFVCKALMLKKADVCTHRQ